MLEVVLIKYNQQLMDKVIKVLSAVTTVLIAAGEVLKQINTYEGNKRAKAAEDAKK